MRRLISIATLATFAAAVTAAVLVAGCGSESTDSTSPPGGQPTVIAQQPSSTLTVETSLTTGGPMYTEGAMAALVLRDSDGQVVGRSMKWPGKTVTFDSLQPGTYFLAPALRPCDGNCGYLDPPTDQCRDRLTVDGDLSVTVKFTVGRRCVVGSPLSS
jgi:hypothetical protein